MVTRVPLLLLLNAVLVLRTVAAPLTNITFVAFDLETTGLNARTDRIIEIGAVKFRNGKTIATMSTFVAPGIPIPPDSQRIHGITDDMVKDAPAEDTAIRLFFNFADGAVLIAHNAGFDMRFITAAEHRAGLEVGERQVIDTLRLARRWWPDNRQHTLSAMSELLKLPTGRSHRALDDAQLAQLIFLAGIDKEAETVTVVELTGAH